MSKAYYIEIFQTLFPEEWKKFVKSQWKKTGKKTLVEVLADLYTGEPPPLGLFTRLMQKHYFPLPDYWDEMYFYAEEFESEDDMYGCAFNEIPLFSIFHSWGEDEGPEYFHEKDTASQLVLTLSGATYRDHIKDNCSPACPLRTMFVLACNERFVVDLDRLAELCRRVNSPLRHLNLATRIVDRSTGNPWVDYVGEDYGGNTGISWTLEKVRWLRDDWQGALKLTKPFSDFGRWIKTDIRRVREASELWRSAAVYK